MAEFVGPISEEEHHWVEKASYVNLEKYMNFTTVVDAMAKWFATIELCEDFICRLNSYGLIHHMDEEKMVARIKSFWRLEPPHEQEAGVLWSGIVKVVTRVLNGLNYLFYLLLCKAVDRATGSKVIGHTVALINHHLSSLGANFVRDKVEKHQAEKQLKECANYFGQLANTLEKRYHEAENRLLKAIQSKKVDDVSQSVCDILVGPEEKYEGKDEQAEVLKMKEVDQSWMHVDKE